MNEAPSGATLGIGTEIHLVNRLNDETPDKTVVSLDPLVCPCSTMFRIDAAHLCWVLENLVEGQVVNRITVDPDTDRVGAGGAAADAGDRLTRVAPAIGEAGHYERDALWDPSHDANRDHQRMRFEATRALIPPGTTTVLELGSGDGRVLQHLVAADPALQVLAADRSQAALRANPFPRLQASLDAVPVADRSVDVVLCCEVLEHLPAGLYDAARTELARVARHSVIVTVPNRENRRRGAIDCSACGCRYNPDRHLRSFTPDDLTDLLPGLPLTALEEAGPRHPVYPRAARLLLERRGLLTRGQPDVPPVRGALRRVPRRPSGAGRRTGCADLRRPAGGAPAPEATAPLLVVRSLRAPLTVRG